jgi:hypothetical protein
LHIDAPQRDTLMKSRVKTATCCAVVKNFFNNYSFKISRIMQVGQPQIVVLFLFNSIINGVFEKSFPPCTFRCPTFFNFISALNNQIVDSSIAEHFLTDFYDWELKVPSNLVVLVTYVKLEVSKLYSIRSSRANNPHLLAC